MTRTPEQRLNNAQLLNWSIQHRHSPRLYKAEENARIQIVLHGDKFDPDAQRKAVMDELYRLLGRKLEKKERNAA